MNRQVIHTEKAPQAIGPYSQAIVVNGMAYTSGQLGFKPGTADLFETVEEQTHQAMKNLQAILEEAGTSLKNVVKTTVFVQDLNDFAKVNEAYHTYFQQAAPARSCVQVAALPKGALVEIEAIAVVE
ncbi:RidA family protein [Brevibacillus laterosporus]|uniref:RidA family protein n=1 Tax=Brevibacillus laterosporus TaxID=1465 RepID=UPI0003677B69|nr:RidA family protein [Brevibacillus laterosporus]ATO47635.1 reactive intermediate/imine deaminase [Brevibacillus laterosporus DSM 25]ATO51903.1 reactive intermediate/imine deaminase [Brevibacillus laterosporus DSM 25]AYB37777.1 RidA family protein [Brevibacillus laterosporus]MBG9804713.1 endoribonuclease L-PSP [Brevibacillus laterosporus]MBM7110079.1 Enamine/imine deaminase [Brevibacillus laterosporus]